METNDNSFFTTQDKLLGLMPKWNYLIAKPFKQLLDEGVSLEMYYCLQSIRFAGGTMTMSKLAEWSKTTKQQTTQTVNRLAELGFIERIYDPSDRRIIKLEVTEKAAEYIDKFLKHDAGCYRELLDSMDEKSRQDFDTALDILHRIFSKFPCNFSE